MTVSKAPTAPGTLCKAGHDDGSGYSTRYLVRGQPIGNCVMCGRVSNRTHRARQRQARQELSESQGHLDGKYEGAPCQRGHLCRKGHTLRYVRDGGCVECDCARRLRIARTNEDKEKSRKSSQNKARAQRGFTGARATERGKSFELESKRRQLHKETKKRAKR